MIEILLYIRHMDTVLFDVSPAARARIAHLLQTEPPGTRLRIAVEGGGCSGFQYQYHFEQSAMGAEDKLFGSEEAPVIVDTISLNYIGGSILDYVESLGAAAFEIKNPKAKASCGCGNSFSVAL